MLPVRYSIVYARERGEKGERGERERARARYLYCQQLVEATERDPSRPSDRDPSRPSDRDPSRPSDRDSARPRRYERAQRKLMAALDRQARLLKCAAFARAKMCRFRAE